MKKPDYISQQDWDSVDNPPLTDQELVTMKLYKGLDGLALLIGEETVAPMRKKGRPKSDNKKQAIRLRLDADILTAFKAQGKGWQTRINNTLRLAIINEKTNHLVKG